MNIGVLQGSGVHPLHLVPWWGHNLTFLKTINLTTLSSDHCTQPWGTTMANFLSISPLTITEIFVNFYSHFIYMLVQSFVIWRLTYSKAIHTWHLRYKTLIAFRTKNQLKAFITLPHNPYDPLALFNWSHPLSGASKVCTKDYCLSWHIHGGMNFLQMSKVLIDRHSWNDIKTYLLRRHLN